MEENENIKEAEEKLEQMKKDKHLQYLAWLREKQRLDSNSMKFEGIMIGREEGLKEGLKKNQIKTAKKLIQKGIPISEICDITELTKEEVEKIEAEIKNDNQTSNSSKNWKE